MVVIKILSLVPYRPEVHIALAVAMPVVAIVPRACTWRRRPEDSVLVFFHYNSTNSLIVEFFIVF